MMFILLICEAMIMSKREKITLKCADCYSKFIKTMGWLETAHYLYCARCQVELDIDEVINEILITDDLEREDEYFVYQR